MAVTTLEWLALSIFWMDAVCPTESATYKILGWVLKLDFELGILCVEVSGEAVEEGLDFSFSFDAVLVGF